MNQEVILSPTESTPPGSATVVVISPAAGVHEKANSALAISHATSSFLSLMDYPTPEHLLPLRDASGGCIVIIDFSDPRRAKSVAAELDRRYPDTAIIALYPGRPTPQDFMELMQLGIREIVYFPLGEIDLSQAASRAARKLMSRHAPEHETGHIYAFLPAKPGVGATTIAINTAAAIARLTDERTLLLDLDLKHGLITFLLKLDGTNSVLDALAASASLEPGFWDQLVSHRGKLEILGSAQQMLASPGTESSAVNLLDFSRRHYNTVCVDLPGDCSDHEMETLHLAKEIFLVCSPDLGVLHLAKRRTEALRRLGLGVAVSVIMNRADGRGSLPISEVEQILEVPVSFSVPSAYARIAEATRKGAVLDGQIPLVRQIENIARHIRPIGGTWEPKGRKFIELFSRV